MRIYVWQNGSRVAEVEHPMNAIVHKELMREWTLKFSITNFDNARQYLNKTAILEVDGQKYTVLKIKQLSGMTNTTDVECLHISCIGNHHFIPAGFSFTGTVHDIIAAMIEQGHVEGSLTVGECVDIGTVSFSLGNTDYQSLRSGLFALSSLGIEIDYDNTTVNAYRRLGSDTGKVFEFGKDLTSIERNFDFSETTDNISYTVEIAALYRIGAQYDNEKFSLGDTVLIRDKIIGDEINGQRIVTYDKCLDDPTQDTVIIGQFANDFAQQTTQMKVAINNRVPFNRPFNNNSVTAENGFVSIMDNQIRVEHSATRGFVIQHSSDNGGSWQDIFFVNSLNGKITISSPDGSKSVEMGADEGFAVYNNGTLAAGLDTDGKSIAEKIAQPGDTNTYGTIGSTSEGFGGLDLHTMGKLFCRLLWTGSNGIVDGFSLNLPKYDGDNSGGYQCVGAESGMTYMQYKGGNGETAQSEVWCDANGVHISGSYNGDIPIPAGTWPDGQNYGAFYIHVKDGTITGYA